MESTAAAAKNKDLILSTRIYAKENPVKSWLLTLFTLLLLVASLAGTVWNYNLAARIFCSVFSGFLIVRMFVIYHDYSHRAILGKSPIAQFIMVIFGIYILAPPSIWRRSHDYHHKHNSKLFGSSIGSYPIMTKQKFLSCSKSERREYLFVRHPLTIFFGYIFMFIYGMCICSFLAHPKKHYDSLIALILHVTAYALVFYFAGWLTVLLFLVVPFTISCGIGSYLFYAQHNFPGVTFEDYKGWTYETAAMESSSFMKLNPLMNWFTANIGYHHIHHLNSRIPFYRLPEVMKKMPEVQHPKITTMKPWDMWKCLKLKVWDSEKRKMISLGEI
jgi:omega-6 fatty acid desaturase (delta-12 desaturase)